MLIRTSITLAAAAGLLLAAVGILVAPGTALGGLAFALLVAAGATAHAGENSGSRSATTSRRSRRVGVIAGGGILSLWLLITGLVALLGSASGVILLTVLMLVLMSWLWWRPGGFASSIAVGSSQREMLEPSPASPADLSTKALCLAWQRSQLTQLDALTAAARHEVVSTRQQLLDEMERRDGAGFNLWLAAGACSGTDPGGYLATDR